jgi:hypothetical protein
MYLIILCALTFFSLLPLGPPHKIAPFYVHVLFPLDLYSENERKPVICLYESDLLV